MRKALVISQVAISLLLLIVAALFTRSLRNLNRVDLGFQRESLMSFTIDPSLNGYTAERARRLAETLRDKLAAAPGARSAAVGVNPVIADNVDTRSIRFEGRHSSEDEDLNPQVDSVSPDYFATLGIPLLAGREFTARDRFGAPRVAIVNDEFARYYFQRENPIGRRFAFIRDKSPIEIVGVVRASKYARIDEQARRVVYTALLQDPNPSGLVVYVRTAAAPRPCSPPPAAKSSSSTLPFPSRICAR